jgi:hypothetical protein
LAEEVEELEEYVEKMNDSDKIEFMIDHLEKEIELEER